MKTAAKKLVIVESPAKAKTIKKFLGDGYKVEPSQGHVRDLPKSQLGVDVDHDFDMKYITIRGRGEILARIRKEAKSASVVYLATDPDREGEAISWHLANVLGIDPKKKCRVEFHEITKKAVKEAIGKPRAIDTNRVNAQQARRALDRLVGYQISPLLWIKVKKGLSAGRVQSVATRMIVEREQEIQAFVPEEYWEVEASFTAANDKGRKIRYTAKPVSKDGKKLEIRTGEEAEKIRKQILKDTYQIASVKTTQKNRKPQPPFTTSALQQDASRKLNFTTAKTMQVVQQLYEGIEIGKSGSVGLVTYIRTDSVRVSEEAVSAAREYITGKYGVEYCPDKPNEYKGRKDAQDAHEAIRPTSVENTPEQMKPYLTHDQYRLYHLIYTRFLASQMKNAVYSAMTVDFAGKKTALRYSGEHLIFPGYRAVYVEQGDEEETEKDSPLPVLKEEETISISEAQGTQFFTQPPPRYTEASLVKTLEENGIGRPSTYAPIITTIIARGYVSREKKRLYPTELGLIVNDLMISYFGDIIETDFTAEMETKLDRVAEGEMEWKEILRGFYPEFDVMLKQAEDKIDKIEIKDRVSDVVCDQCGAMMVYKMGRYGEFLACPNFPACHNTKPILHYIDAECPKCGGRLMEKTSKKNRKFYGCENYPACEFVSWEKPIRDRCPKCGSYMVLKPGKNQSVIHLCANESCRYKETVEIAEKEDEE